MKPQNQSSLTVICIFLKLCHFDFVGINLGKPDVLFNENLYETSNRDMYTENWHNYNVIQISVIQLYHKNF